MKPPYYRRVNPGRFPSTDWEPDGSLLIWSGPELHRHAELFQPQNKMCFAGLIAIVTSDLYPLWSFCFSCQPHSLPRSTVALIRRLTQLAVPFIYIPQARLWRQTGTRSRGHQSQIVAQTERREERGIPASSSHREGPKNLLSVTHIFNVWSSFCVSLRYPWSFAAQC